MATKPKASDRQYAEARHFYTDPRTGERLVSVTSIVGSFDPGDKLGAGAAAAVKLTKEGQNYRSVWDAKRDLGSAVHDLAALWAQGKAADVPEELAPYMDGFEKFCSDCSPTFIEQERAVVHSAGYGGRFDLVAEMSAFAHADEFTLLDLKTGKPYKAELTLQLVGYAYADGMVLYDEAGMARFLEPMPHIDTCAGLYLHDDGTYDLTWAEVDDNAFDMFLNLLAVKNWAKAQ